jgi:hypothetical protein
VNGRIPDNPRCCSSIENPDVEISTTLTLGEGIQKWVLMDTIF